jgi:hypothetical protein
MPGAPVPDHPSGAAPIRIPKPAPGALARLLALLARPVHRAQGRGGLVIEAYRGYGSREP